MRLAAVKYHNTLPLLHGIRQSSLRDEAEVILDHPANCAVMLREGLVDIALCPVGALVDTDDYHILTDYGICCDGPVRTVAVYSHVPLDKLERIVLTRASRTSNLLVQILEHHHWQLGLDFIPEGEPPVTDNRTGHLHIGDVCFQKEKEYPCITDLGESWKQYTGLPFVFACWVALRPVDPDFVARLNGAFAQGVDDIERLVGTNANGIDFNDYLRRNIQFKLDNTKRKAMQLFLNAAQKLVTLPSYAIQDTR